MQDSLGIIAAGELETLAAARRILQTWEKRAGNAHVTRNVASDSFHAGLIAEAASQADGRAFDALNALSSYADADIPDDVLHARASSEPEAPRREVRVVVHVESDPPEVLGTFIAEDRGFVVYLTTNGVERSEPAGSVAVVTIAV